MMRSRFTAGERPAVVCIAVLLVLRLWFVLRHGVDSDEPQHLHVIYGWLKGEIPYLDRFDNHTPLFAWFFMPLAGLLGETPDVVLWARIAEIPLSFGVLGLLYLLVSRLHGRTVALWTVALTLALADWALKSVEFRPDVLWTVLFFLALLILTKDGGAIGWRGYLLAGLVLGAAFAASIKTSFLVCGLGLGWATAWAVSPAMRAYFTPARIASSAVAAVAGFLVVPACFIGWFAVKGALPAMTFALLEVNQPEPAGWRMVWFFAGAPVAAILGARFARAGWLPAAVFLSAAFYALLVAGFSPSLKKQTYLPAYPLLVMAGVAAWERQRPCGVALPAGLCVALTAHQILEGAPWRDGMRDQRELLQETLKLTAPDDFLFDLKGETVFRRRPVHLAYVLATTRGIESGRLEDEDPQRLSETGTAVVVADGTGFSPPMRKFMKDHYLPVGAGRLRVAGRVLKPSWENGIWVERANVAVAGEYVILRNGVVEQEIRVTEPGMQRFDFGTERGQRLLFWKPAWDAGFRPLAAAE
jgi:hypothetical protein